MNMFLMYNLENYKRTLAKELFSSKRLCLEIGCGKGRFIAQVRRSHRNTGVETQHDIAYYPGKLPKKIRWIISRSTALMQSIWRTGSSRARSKCRIWRSKPYLKASRQTPADASYFLRAKYQRLLGKGGHLRFRNG